MAVQKIIQAKTHVQLHEYGQTGAKGGQNARPPFLGGNCGLGLEKTIQKYVWIRTSLKASLRNDKESGSQSSTAKEHSLHGTIINTLISHTTVVPGEIIFLAHLFVLFASRGSLLPVRGFSHHNCLLVSCEPSSRSAVQDSYTAGG